MAACSDFSKVSMGTKKLIIVGAGGHGRAVAEAALLSTAWSEVVFVDDSYPAQQISGRWPIVANTQSLLTLVSQGDHVIVAIGNQATRKRLFDTARAAGATMATVIHPKAWVSADADLGEGTAIMAGAVIGIQAKLGMGAIVNANATVDHDAILGDFAHLGVGVQLAGGVIVGDSAWLQAGACAGYRVKVPPAAVVAPGTVLVAKD